MDAHSDSKNFFTLALQAACLLCQTNTPKFEVVSIKPSGPGRQGTMVRGVGTTHIFASYVTPKRLIEMAYYLYDFQIEAVPSWADSEHYDIAAQSEEPANLEQSDLMLQGVLAERFKLAFHR